MADGLGANLKIYIDEELVAGDTESSIDIDDDMIEYSKKNSNFTFRAYKKQSMTAKGKAMIDTTDAGLQAILTKKMAREMVKIVAETELGSFTCETCVIPKFSIAGGEEMQEAEYEFASSGDIEFTAA
jgi:Zn finger protein HypA/HybF involved in hydrogenase expression